VTWTGTPKTWPFQGALLSSDFNVEIRDRFLAMGPHLIARRTSDQTNSTTTLTDENTLVMPSIATNEVWLFRWVLWIAAVATTDMKMGWTFPSGGTVGASMETITGTRAIDNTSGGSTTLTNGVNTSWPAPLVLTAMYVQASTAGILQLRFAAAAAGSITMKTHSTLWGVKLA
jgi:hypothetical protein